MDRPLYHRLWRDLSSEKAMILIAGPRQVGKTTLARIIAKGRTNRIERNWDIPRDREEILRNPTFFEQINLQDGSRPIVVLDEIHKFRRWKNFLKGAYDEHSDQFDFLVLGSGKLDTYQKGGDSLAGRYALFTLWPFTVAELGKAQQKAKDFFKDPLIMHKNTSTKTEKIWSKLEKRSGFPEPYLAKNISTYLRWSQDYGRQLVREDIRSLTQIQDIDTVEILWRLLPERVGSPLSVESLRRDLGVAHKSVQHWLSVFESLFLIRRIHPWSINVARAIRKEQKLYLLDYPRISNPAARFENMVALELMRATSAWNERGLGIFDLRYVRNTEKKEVDFLIINKGKPWLLIECKLSKDSPSSSLRKFQNELGVNAIQLVRTPNIYKRFSNNNNSIVIYSASEWLSRLP